MTSYDPKRYKHLPKFGYFVYNCHVPNESVNHSETPYVVPEDYKNDDDFLRHYRSLRLSRNTDIDYIGAFPHFYYVVDLYETKAYNQPHPDPTPFIQCSKDYTTSLHSGKLELDTRFVLEFLANSNILNRSFPTNLGSILQRNPVCGQVCKLPRNLSIV